MKCESCKYWDSGNGTGLCRYGAPRPLVVRPTQGHKTMDALWPRTKEDDWCGQWSAKVEVEPEA